MQRLEAFPSPCSAAQARPLPAHAPRLASAYCLVLLALLTVTTGCMTSFREYIDNGFKVGPNYKKPAAPIAENWIDYKDPRVISQPQHTWAWWQVFNDPTLDRLVQHAYAQNLTLREAGLRVMEARALRDITVGNLFPQQQEAFGSYTRQQQSLESFGAFGGGGVPGGGLGINRNFSMWQFGTQLAWELDFWGRFRRAIEAAEAELDASIENYDDVLVILLGDVASTYIEIRTLEEQIAYARNNVRSQVGSLNIAIAKQEEGVASRLDITQAQQNVATTEATIPQLQAQHRQAQNRLSVLLGMPPQDLTEMLGGPGRIPQTPINVAVGVPADLIRRRPDVRRAEREVAAQSARIGIAEADLYPAFTISGTIFVQANQFERLFRSSAVGGNIGPSFNWNILNYGRIRNAVIAEQARFMQEVTQYQNTVLNANQEAEDAIVAFLRAQEQARFLREAALASEESRDLVNDLYRGGRADFGRVFLAELTLVQQQNSLAQAEGAIAQSLVNLYRALGGGWELRLQGAAEGELVALPVAEPIAPPPVPQQNPAPGEGNLPPANPNVPPAADGALDESRLRLLPPTTYHPSVARMPQ